MDTLVGSEAGSGLQRLESWRAIEGPSSELAGWWLSAQVALPAHPPTSGAVFDAHVPPIVLHNDGAAAGLVLQAQHAGAAGQEVARVVKGVEANQVCGQTGGAEGGRGGAQVGRKVECSCRDASCTRQPNTQRHPTPSTQQQGSCGAGASAAPALSIERMTSSRRGKVRKISEEGKGECRKMPHLQRQAQGSRSTHGTRNQQSRPHVLPRVARLPACLPARPPACRNRMTL